MNLSSIFPHHLRQQHKHACLAPSPRHLRDSDTYNQVKKKRLRLQSCDPKCPCLSGMQYPSGICYPTDARRVRG